MQWLHQCHVVGFTLRVLSLQLLIHPAFSFKSGTFILLFTRLRFTVQLALKLIINMVFQKSRVRDHNSHIFCYPLQSPEYASITDESRTV